MVKNALFLFLFAVILLLVFLPSYTEWQDLKQKNADYQRELELLKENTTTLTEENRLLEEDPVYLEKVGREKMGLIKEGEFVYKLVPAAKEE